MNKIIEEPKSLNSGRGIAVLVGKMDSTVAQIINEDIVKTIPKDFKSVRTISNDGLITIPQEVRTQPTELVTASAVVGKVRLGQVHTLCIVEPSYVSLSEQALKDLIALLKGNNRTFHFRSYTKESGFIYNPDTVVKMLIELQFKKADLKSRGALTAEAKSLISADFRKRD